MSEGKSNGEQFGLNKVPEHPRDIAELAALVVGNLRPHEPEDENRSLMIFVWRDCAMTIKFPSEKMYVAPSHNHTLDSTIHEVAVGAITEYCRGAGFTAVEIRIHIVPPELSEGDQIFAWFQSIPGISIRVLPPEQVGFGGPLPPAGEAG